MKRNNLDARARRAVHEAEVGAVYAFRVPDGRFGACQVVSAQPAKHLVEIATLDYLSSERPAAAHVSRLNVMRQTWANWNGQPARCNVDPRVPWWVERIAVIPPIEQFTDECKSFGHWLSGFGAYHRHQWERGGRRAWRFDNSQVRVDLGGGPAELRRDTSHLRIGPDGTVRPPATGRVQFDALDVLPCLNEIDYTGGDAGFLDYTVSRKLSKVAWHDHGQRTIDLRASCIEALSLDARDQPVTLRAPETLQTLTVSGRAEQVTVEGARQEFPFRLRLQGGQIARPPHGLEAVQSVEYVGLSDTDSSGLARYSQLAELTLRGAPGKLRDASGFGGLQALRELEIYELYALDGEHWPSRWPVLDGVRIHGVRKVDAQSIKAALASVPDVRITGARGDDWIAANLDNPFRRWEDDNRSFGRAACAAWKTAHTEATKLGAHARQADAKQLLHALVTTLNRLHGKYDIDTVRREEAAAAFFTLARNVGISDDQAASWFDAWRDF